MMMKKPLSPPRSELRKLVESLGGEARLQALLLGFYEEMSLDAMIGFFFTGKNLESISKKQGEFILMAAGMLAEFKGKGPATAHTELPPILPGHFDRRIQMLTDYLKRQGLDSAQIKAWTSFEESFRAVVVRQTRPS